MSLITPAPVSDLDLEPLVATVDDVFADAVGGALLAVVGTPPDVRLGVMPLYGSHPFDELLGLVAPTGWAAVGLHCGGHAHALDDMVDADVGSLGEPAEVRLTMLVGRDGRGTALMREGSVVTPLPGVPEGPIADACRRALGIPTAEPPPTTTELWLRVWLDRVVEHVAFDDDVERCWTFADLAVLHPAWLGPTAVDPPCGLDPDGVAEASQVLAEAWTWSRLRASPDLVETQRPPLTAEAAEWMDDGMFARWLLGEVTALELTLPTAAKLLTPPVLGEIDGAIRATGARP